MKITLNLVLECLSDYYCENYIGEAANCTFSHLRLFDPELCRFDPDTLYVCPLTVAIGCSAEHPDTSYICLRDRFRLDDETEEMMKNKIVVTENIELTHLYSKLKLFFDGISEWDAAMWSAAAKGADLGRVLDMSRGVIGNSINVTDSSMRLIASTDTETDDKITLRLRKYGYHTDESRESFRKAGCYDEWNTRQNVYTSIIPEMSPYLMVNRIFKFRDVYFLQIVMVCDHRPFSPGLLDLFNMLLEVLETYIDKQRSSIIELDSTTERIISDLIDNDPEKRESVRSRLYTAGVPYTGSYRVIAAAPAERSPTALDGLKAALLKLFPDAFCAIYHKRVVALLRGAGELSVQWAVKLEGLLEKHGCCCGVSMLFSSMADFSEEYAHASTALGFSGVYCRSGHMPDLRGENETPLVWFYDRLSMIYPVSERLKGTASWKKSPYWTKLLALYEADAAHGTNNVELLYYFLRSERRGKAAADMLHMHRNNVAYRISRICEITGFDLDDADTRMNLSIAFIMLKTSEGRELE
jgi:hypothetical protein